MQRPPELSCVRACVRSVGVRVFKLDLPVQLRSFYRILQKCSEPVMADTSSHEAGCEKIHVHKRMFFLNVRKWVLGVLPNRNECLRRILARTALAQRYMSPTRTSAAFI